MLAQIDPGFIIWLVIIAIFGLSNLLKSGKKQQKPPPRRQTQPPPQAGGRTTPPPRPQPRQQSRQQSRQQRGAQTEQEIRVEQARERAQRERDARDSKRAATARNQQAPQGKVTRAQQQQQQRPQQAPPPRTGSRPPSMEEQMRQLYEQMTGQPAGNKPSRPPPDRRIKVAPKPAPAPDPRLKVKPPAPMSAPPPAAPEAPTAPSEEDAFAMVEEIQDLMTSQESMDHHTGGKHNTMGTRSMLIDLGKLNLPLMRIPIMAIDTVDNAAKRPDLRNKKVLRSAVLARVILEKPKAMQASPNEDAEQI